MPSEQAASADTPRLTYAQLSKALNRLVTERDGEWCGIPMPLPGLGLELAPGHPLREQVAALQRIVDDKDGDVRAEWDVVLKGAYAEEGRHTVVNSWRGRNLHGADGEVFVLRRADGSYRAAFEPAYPAANRHLFGPFETFDAWSLATELTAMESLKKLLSERMFKAYVLTGSFLETSKRSGIAYVFRRLRPTVAITFRGTREDFFYGCAVRGEGSVLSALCLHPLAYYKETMCGAMCPTDDVIAHLLLMRGDEHLYWKRANQHPAGSPNAGLGI